MTNSITENRANCHWTELDRYIDLDLAIEAYKARRQDPPVGTEEIFGTPKAAKIYIYRYFLGPDPDPELEAWLTARYDAELTLHEITFGHLYGGRFDPEEVTR